MKKTEKPSIILTDAPAPDKMTEMIEAKKAPLVETDINELGLNRKLHPEDAVIKFREENNAEAVRQFRRYDPEEFGNAEKALGRRIDPHDLIRRITKLNPLVIVMPGGIPGHAAVRYPGMEYATGFPVAVPCLPEFSCVVYDERGVDAMEVRGWRDVLKALIKKGAFTLEAVNKEFGIATGNRAERWDAAAQNKIQ